MPRMMLLSGLIALPSIAMACPEAAMQQAAASADIAAVSAAHAEVLEAGPACTAAQRRWAGRVAALLHASEAQRQLTRGVPPTTAAEILDRALQLGRPWQVLQFRGELAMRTRDERRQANWTAALLFLEEAINELHDDDQGPEPTDAEKARLWRLAEQARMLAPQIPPSPRMRSGAPGGLETRNWRGVSVGQVAAPVHFVFDTADPTADGVRAIEAMFRMLDGEGRPPVTLIGHTDPRGTDAYNMNLSERRARRVRDELVARGYSVERIALDWRGEREPTQPAIPDLYQEEEYFQILRRVVLVRR